MPIADFVSTLAKPEKAAPSVSLTKPAPASTAGELRRQSAPSFTPAHAEGCTSRPLTPVPPEAGEQVKRRGKPRAPSVAGLELRPAGQGPADNSTFEGLESLGYRLSLRTEAGEH